jgi:hypothetical protein
MKKYPLACVFIVLTLLSAQGGGSIEWNFHAIPILKKHPELLSIINTSLEVSKTGDGLRLGKDFGEEQGKRIPPYKFPARTKGSSGAFDLILIIHDPSGAHEEGDEQTWIEIRPRKKA